MSPYSPIRALPDLSAAVIIETMYRKLDQRVTCGEEP
jgi:hypothetical protein